MIQNNKRILVADDEPSILKIVPMILNMHNYHNITAVDNGKKALDELLNNHYDLYITDTHMPGLKGYEVIQQYKASPKVNGTRFIAMSGNFDSSLNALYVSFGAALLSKPFLPNDLVSIVKSNIN